MSDPAPTPPSSTCSASNIADSLSASSCSTPATLTSTCSNPSTDSASSTAAAAAAAADTASQPASASSAATTSSSSSSSSSISSSSSASPSLSPSPSLSTLGASLHPSLLSSLRALLFGSSPHLDDVNRWHNQPFSFSSSSSSPSYCLTQQHGGPCGVLASVQAFIIRQLAFVQQQAAPPALQPEDDPPQPIRCTEEQVTQALVEALAHILQRATPTSFPFTIVFSPTLTRDQYRLYLCFSPADITSFFTAHLSQLLSPLGVVLFVYSVLLSRTLDSVKRDMDDSSLPLVARFGHSSQELVNLMLTGRAVTNLFDGNKQLGVEDAQQASGSGGTGAGAAAGQQQGQQQQQQQESAFQLKGLTSRNEIGFLTVLEALRYSSVGEHYKTPLFPIWVVGSSSHYTVLFALRRSITSVSPQQLRAQRLRALFNAFDPAENGFLAAAELPALLLQLREKLPLPCLDYYLNGSCSEAELQQVADPEGMGLVLWQSVGALVQHAEAKSEQRPREWSCGACTFLNPAARTTCDMCATAKPPAAAAAAAPPSSSSSSSGGGGVANFSLYHLNGLESVYGRPCLSRVSVTDVNAGSGGVLAGGQERNDGGQGLREVIRTRWPSAIVSYIGTEPRIA